MTKNKKTLIILPTYNEKENLAQIIARIFETLPLAHVLVIDDNSPDGTGKIADDLSRQNPAVAVIHRKKKEGLGRAYLEGFRYALDSGYEYVFEMDADFSHNPVHLPEMITAADDADLVIGSRYITGVNVINWPMSRLLLSYFANLYARLITGMPIRDATGGFKCFRRRVLEKLNLKKISSSGYSFQIEVNYICWKKGFKMKEIPIVFVERKYGQSKMSTGIIREALFLLWKLRLKSLFVRNLG
jgi:dolichol-phosphate mannosyltransferase